MGYKEYNKSTTEPIIVDAFCLCTRCRGPCVTVDYHIAIYVIRAKPTIVCLALI